MRFQVWGLNNASLCHSQSRRVQCSEYIKAREKVWNEQKILYGSRLWNGVVYTIDRLEGQGDVVLYLGQCEYKDIMIKESFGADLIATHYGESCVVQHLIICVVPITSDGLFVLSIVGDGTIQQSGMIDLFGGTANQDEVAVNDFHDLSKFALLEIKEEAGWSESCGRLKPWLLAKYNHKYAMFFQFQLNVSSTNLKTTLEKSEVSSILIATRADIAEMITEYCSVELRVFSLIIKDSNYEL